MSVFARIILRWIAGALIGWGIITAQEADMLSSEPELIGAVVTSIEFMAGLAIGTATEAWYWAAKKMGWRT